MWIGLQTWNFTVTFNHGAALMCRWLYEAFWCSVEDFGTIITVRPSFECEWDLVLMYQNSRSMYASEQEFIFLQKFLAFRKQLHATRILSSGCAEIVAKFKSVLGVHEDWAEWSVRLSKSGCDFKNATSWINCFRIAYCRSISFELISVCATYRYEVFVCGSVVKVWWWVTSLLWRPLTLNLVRGHPPSHTCHAIRRSFRYLLLLESNRVWWSIENRCSRVLRWCLWLQFSEINQKIQYTRHILD